MRPQVSAPTAAGTPPVTADAPAWGAAWSQALEEVELDVVAAEALLRLLHEGREAPGEADLVPRWRTPRVEHPLPPELADRARLLLQRQLDVSQRLAEALVHTRSERRAMAKLEPAEHRPVFVDQAL